MSENDEASWAGTGDRRVPNWTDSECNRLLKEGGRYREDLLMREVGYAVILRKKQIYHEIAQRLNKANPLVKRNAEQVKRKWTQLMCTSKKELQTRQKTPPQPPASNQVMNVGSNVNEGVGLNNNTKTTSPELRERVYSNIADEIVDVTPNLKEVSLHVGSPKENKKPLQQLGFVTLLNDDSPLTSKPISTSINAANMLTEKLAGEDNANGLANSKDHYQNVTDLTTAPKVVTFHTDPNSASTSTSTSISTSTSTSTSSSEDDVLEESRTTSFNIPHRQVIRSSISKFTPAATPVHQVAPTSGSIEKQCLSNCSKVTPNVIYDRCCQGSLHGANCYQHDGELLQLHKNQLKLKTEILELQREKLRLQLSYWQRRMDRAMH